MRNLARCHPCGERVAGFITGGASLPVTENAEGKTVIGVRKIKDGLKAGVDAAGGIHIAAASMCSASAASRWICLRPLICQ